MRSVRFYSKFVKEVYPNSKIKIFRKAKITSNIEKKVKFKDSLKPAVDIKTQKKQHDAIPKEKVLANVTKKYEVVETKILETDSIVENNKNLVNIQMISQNLHEQLFPHSPRSSNMKYDYKFVKMKQDLHRHGIDINSTEIIPDVNLTLPPLKGKNIEEHFLEIGREQVRPYKDLLKSLVELKSLPMKPVKWSFQEGWTVYDPGSGTYMSIDYPLENSLIIDVEVCMNEGAMPTLATAVGCKHWYSWVSPDLATEAKKINMKPKVPHYSLDELIPLGNTGPKILVGHNVSYDRARLREEYLLHDSKIRFIDTMSLHVCVSGVTSYQRAIMKSKKEPAPEDIDWLNQSSLNSLSEVHRLYCGDTINKEGRNIFVEGTLRDIRKDFQTLMSYCSNDVAATHRILQKLFPLFEERFPHPVTLAGMLEMGSSYLPINKNWLRYINEADLAYEELSIESKYHLRRRADEACRLLKDEQYKQNLWLWDEDWSIQELKLKPLKKSTPKIKNQISNSYHQLEPTTDEKNSYGKFKYLYDMKDQLPSRRPFLPGYPAWYRKLCQKIPKDTNNTDWSPGPTEISTGMQIVPKLLSLCWEGYPLHYTKEHGWGFLVPFTSKHPETESDNTPRIPIEKLVKQCPIPEFAQLFASEKESHYAFANLQKDLDTKLCKREFYKKTAKNNPINAYYNGSGVWCNTIIDNCCFFFKLPHKNGKSFRVGNPLSKDFINKFSENVLSSGEPGNNIAKRVIEIARMISYWRNNRDRIIGQLAVWLTSDELPENIQNEDYEFGAICPQIVVCGTLTRRAMEPTWMTASNSQQERIGSELRAMVQAPPNYRIVGADVDSQELWIASVLGDAYAYGMHGTTPLGWMTLSGTKLNGTDMHSMTAKAVGISRDHAKVINYARIYGAGQNFAEGLLKQFNPTFSAAEARNKAIKMFALTKGKKVYRLKEEFCEEYECKSYSSYEAFKLASSNNKSVQEMFKKPCWEDGSESAMFNCLEEIAAKDYPATPFLGSRLSRALETNNFVDGSRFLPTRINWVVQSGAVDFLHLMLVSMRWLLGDKARFCFSFHDELRYLVEEKYAYHAALAMHITNLLTRSFCSSRLGLNDLPMSVAFFSSVEVDSVLRKECTMDCKTPSNPHGLNLGYGIPPGESLSIYEAIKKVGDNDISKWNWIK